MTLPLNGGVPFEFVYNWLQGEDAEGQDVMSIGGRAVPLTLVRNERARRYLLRVKPPGIVRVTVPRRGSLREGRKFAEANTPWIEQQLARVASRVQEPNAWTVGGEILWRGEPTRIEVDVEKRMIQVGEVRIRSAILEGNLRGLIERNLRRLAEKELPPRVLEFAALHALTVARVSVRSQRSRWGSCSRRATISLNWRLIQTPAFVRDYIILHELMHLRQMNHSARYWREVESVCPDYMVAERWLKQHGAKLLRE